MRNLIDKSHKLEVGKTLPEINRHKQLEADVERFKSIYAQEICQKNNIKISAHATQRLKQRNIELSNQDLEALSKGMSEVEKKGGKESLLLYKDCAFIASIRNRTVITAVKQNEAQENIFTNIDSAIIIDK